MSPYGVDRGFRRAEMARAQRIHGATIIAMRLMERARIAKEAVSRHGLLLFWIVRGVALRNRLVIQSDEGNKPRAIADTAGTVVGLLLDQRQTPDLNVSVLRGLVWPLILPGCRLGSGDEAWTTSQ